MSLSEEIRDRRAEIRTDGYPISIGELINMYRDNELEIQPEYQRYFRWSDFQKSRLVESLLLGIPIPSVFVSQRHSGEWDVIDGLQRLSTIFELVGLLRDAEGNRKEPLKLVGTRYLPSLEGRTWKTLGSDNQLLIKRSKIDVRIVERESDAQAKYELFQRLNTGGSPLSDQELRNCVIVMLDASILTWLRELVQYEPYRRCLSLSPKQERTQYDLELLVRFLVLRCINIDEIGYRTDLANFLTDHLTRRIAEKTLDLKEEERVFRSVFDKLDRELGEDSFKQSRNGSFKGRFLVSAFEVLAIGLGFHASRDKPLPDAREAAAKMWKDPEFQRCTGAGVSATRRIPQTIQYGRDLFASE